MQRSRILLLADLKGGGVGGSRNSFPGEHRWPRGGRCFRMGRCRNGMAEEGPAPSSACMGGGGHDGGDSCTAQCFWREAGPRFCARVTSPGSCPASQPLSLQGQQHLVLTSERRSSFCWLGASHMGVHLEAGKGAKTSIPGLGAWLLLSSASRNPGSCTHSNPVLAP